MKKFVCILLIALSLVSLTSCLGAKARARGAQQTAEEINAASHLPLPLLTPHEDVREELRADQSMDYINNFMSFDYYAPAYVLIFQGFPEDDSASCLTSVELSSDAYDILGVKVGGDIAQGAAVIRDNGFTEDEDAFSKNGVFITLEGDTTIESIRVKVPSEYTSGNIY